MQNLCSAVCVFCAFFLQQVKIFVAFVELNLFLLCFVEQPVTEFIARFITGFIAVLMAVFVANADLLVIQLLKPVVLDRPRVVLIVERVRFVDQRM